MMLACLVACGGGESSAWQGRVATLSTFADPDVARRAGCLSQGTQAGAGFGAYVEQAGGIGALVEARPAPWVLILEARSGPGGLQLYLLEGAEGALGQLSVADTEYARAPFAAQVEDQEVEAEAVELRLPPAAMLGSADLIIARPAIFGSITTDEAGLSSSGVISGYLARDRADPALLAASALDVRLAEGAAEACDGAACDALSVCFAYLVEPMSELAAPF